MVKLLRVVNKHISKKHLDTLNQVLFKGHEMRSMVDRNANISGAYFILGEYYSSSNKELSEDYYTKGNKLIAEMQRESLFIRQKVTKLIYEHFLLNNYEDVKKSIDPKKGEGLIFVLGMPRSGTTLTESILATANDIVAGGEKSFFFRYNCTK